MFYRRAADGDGLAGLECAVQAMETLAVLLDHTVGATASITERLHTETEERERRAAPD